MNFVLKTDLVYYIIKQKHKLFTLSPNRLQVKHVDTHTGSLLSIFLIEITNLAVKLMLLKYHLSFLVLRLL